MNETTKLVVVGVVGVVIGVVSTIGYAKYAYNKQTKGGNNGK